MLNKNLISYKSTVKPWISGDICATIKKRQNYYSLVGQNKMPFNSFNYFKNFATNQIRQANINYFAKSLNNLREIVKALGNK